MQNIETYTSLIKRPATGVNIKQFCPWHKITFRANI